MIMTSAMHQFALAVTWVPHYFFLSIEDLALFTYSLSVYSGDSNNGWDELYLSHIIDDSEQNMQVGECWTPFPV